MRTLRNTHPCVPTSSITRFFLFLIALSIHTPAVLRGSDRSDLQAQLRHLQSFPRVEGGFRSLAEEYERLIKKSEGIVGLEQATFDLGRLHSGHRDRSANSIGDSRQSAVKWYRRTLEIAVPGEYYWIEAAFALVAQFQEPAATREERVQARQLLDELGSYAGKDPLVAVRVKSRMALQFLAEDDIAAAGGLCLQLLALERQLPSNQGDLDAEHAVLRNCQFTATSVFLTKLQEQNIPREEKLDWIHKLSSACGECKWLVEQFDSATANVNSTYSPSDLPASPRSMLMFANVVFLLLFAAFLRRKAVADTSKAPQ